MHVGCPKEIKPQEFRVGLTPDAVQELVGRGHRVSIQAVAGTGAGFTDPDYTAAGAEIAPDAASVFAAADMIVKVKEPQAGERAMLRGGQLLFTYLHLAPDPDQTRDLLASGATAIAYETVTDARGGLPLLAPMSEVAGRLAPQMGAWALQKANGGRGVLLGGVPGGRMTSSSTTSTAGSSQPMRAPSRVARWRETVVRKISPSGSSLGPSTTDTRGAVLTGRPGAMA